MLVPPENVLALADWRIALAAACREVMRPEGFVLVCLAGPPSAGKSTLGVEIRRKGLPGFSKRRVAVIDDCVMSIDFFGFPLGRVRDRTKQLGLAPFARWLRRRRVVVFIGIRPWERVDYCDILVQVDCSYQERRNRQMSRGKTSSAVETAAPPHWVRRAKVFEVRTG